MRATKQLLNKLLICDITISVLGVISAVVSAVVLPESKPHVGHLIAAVGAFIALLLYVVAVTMLFVGQYWAWKLYLAASVVGVVLALPSGYLIISSVDLLLSTAGAILTGVVTCVAIALEHEPEIITASSTNG